MSTRTSPLRTATIVDVAAEANVSKSTVSLVLKGSNLIKGETADRVREAAQKLGYVYNRRAGELRGNASNAIGVVINDLMNPFFAEVLVGIERKLVQAGYVVLMAHTHEDLAVQEKVLQSMREHHAAGVMLCPALGTPKSILKQLQSWGIPLTIFVRNLGPGSYDFAGSDSDEGVFLATNHLLNTGHVDVGFLGGQRGVVFTQRTDGYKRALKEKNIPYREELVFNSNPSREGGYQAMKELLSKQPTLKAVVCYNDIVAFGALSALGEAGIIAGKDFALIGFDNILDTEHSNPPLSTVDIHPGSLGEQAATLLLERIQNPGAKRMVYSSKPNLLLRQTA
jgi:LacI family transcriptional regulator